MNSLRPIQVSPQFSSSRYSPAKDRVDNLPTGQMFLDSFVNALAGKVPYTFSPDGAFNHSPASFERNVDYFA